MIGITWKLFQQITLKTNELNLLYGEKLRNPLDKHDRLWYPLRLRETKKIKIDRKETF